jgi:solute carrier family 45, member 1/2/4
MIIGSLLCVFALLLFGYTRPVASAFIKLGTSAVCFYSVLSLHLIDWRMRIQNNVLTIWLAVLSIYFIDFSVNAGPSPFLFLLSLPHLTSTPKQ